MSDRQAAATISPRGRDGVLDADDYRHYVERFNASDVEDVVNLVPNAEAWQWMQSNVPLFACPDADIEEIYYYRWWTFRKHLKATPAGTIVTEFITPVRHAGSYNSISCALGHHLAEGRWLRDQRFLDEYVNFWFHGGDSGGAEPKFHNYSSWVAWAMLDRARTTGDFAFVVGLLDNLVVDYVTWEREKLRPDGLFWQFDVRDGMEESISGSRTHKNARPTINSYMYGNAQAITEIALRAGRDELVTAYANKAAALKKLVLERLWDPHAQFFKAQTNEGPLSDAREAIGFIPWCFNLPDAGAGYEEAWVQLPDPDGFWAPFGITTAERRHPRFRSHGVGQCEWDGAVWPFATSQTLAALANVLRHYDQPHVTKQHYLQTMRTYAKSQHWSGGEPYVGEYLDETSGAWLKGDHPRSRYYNHSTYCDLVIAGLVGLVPRGDDVVKLAPLLPPDAWDWFCLDGVPYHGRTLTIVWDRHGQKYDRGAGLSVFADGWCVARSRDLEPLRGDLR